MSSLTNPMDRASDRPYTPSLTEEETKRAVSALNNTSLLSFPQVERRYADPPVEGQKIVLVSFVPSKGAKPDQHGVFGFAKVRGSYLTEHEANERAEYLVKNVDSYHQIYHARVGQPFPLTESSDFSKEVAKVDIKKQLIESISEDVKKKREKEQQDIEEIKQKEKNLLEDVKKSADPENPETREDQYTMLRVKKAQLLWTYLETEKKLHQMLGSIARAKREIEQTDAKFPDLKDKYYQKYVEARKQAGLDVDDKALKEGFMRYLVEDIAVPAVDAEYERLYGSK